MDLEAADIVDQFPELFALKGSAASRTACTSRNPAAPCKAVEEDRIPARVTPVTSKCRRP